MAASYDDFAFPCPADDKSGWPATYGMKRRDWLAGQVIAGICAHPDTWGLHGDQIGTKAYEIADAAIAASAD